MNVSDVEDEDSDYPERRIQRFFDLCRMFLTLESVIAEAARERRYVGPAGKLLSYVDIDEFVFRASDKLFHKMIRLDREQFAGLCLYLRNHFVFCHSTSGVGRKQRPVHVQLFVVLWRLAHNASYSEVSFIFRVAEGSIKNYSDRICKALALMHQQVSRFPQTVEQMKSSGLAFFESTVLPGCIGVIDGTHIPIRAPREWAPDYFCFKKYHSLNNVCVVDASLCFIYSRTGFPGAAHDQANFVNSELYGMRSLMNEAGVYILGDTGYACRDYMLCGFKQPRNGSLTSRQIQFNTNLSRVRVVVERAFGILKSKWRILRQRLETDTVFMAMQIILACFFLHNYQIQWDDGTGKLFCPELFSFSADSFQAIENLIPPPASGAADYADDEDEEDDIEESEVSLHVYEDENLLLNEDEYNFVASVRQMEGNGAAREVFPDRFAETLEDISFSSNEKVEKQKGEMLRKFVASQVYNLSV
eukprot:ANDGO_07402.mRNA.1 hypothetical protein PPTG_21631